MAPQYVRMTLPSLHLAFAENRNLKLRFAIATSRHHTQIIYIFLEIYKKLCSKSYFCLMGRKNKKKVVFENVKVPEAGAKGVSVAKAPEGQVIFISNVVPGDVVD